MYKLSLAMFIRPPSVKARGLSEGVEQLEITVLEVILHVVPEIHCRKNGDLIVSVSFLTYSLPTHPPDALQGPASGDWAAPYQQCSHGTVGRGGTTGPAGRASRQPALCSRVPGPDCNWGTAPDLEPRGLVGSKAPGDTVDARE